MLFKKLIRLIIILIVGVFLLQRSDLEQGDRVEMVQAFTRQLEFDFVSWTWDALWLKTKQESIGVIDYIPAPQQSEIVLNYLELIGHIRQIESDINKMYADPSVSDPVADSRNMRDLLAQFTEHRDNLAPLVESIFQNQLSTTVNDLGLTLLGQPVPPILYHMTPTPKALIVSPRDIIRQDANIAILPEISIDQQENLEKDVAEALDVSTLVVGVGGIGLYPTMVMETTSVHWLAEVVSHEWVHNFLTLRPLGASYGASPELRIINETVANLVEKEIGSAMVITFYPEFVPQPPPPQSEDHETDTTLEPPPFDFQTEMHITRVAVDTFLDNGDIEAAESYMETRREFFWRNGYHLRKLNQAYFAFYGAYADEPGGASGAVEDPIGDAVRELRSQSPSLAQFLNKISWMWSLEQLQDAVQEGNH